MHVKQSISFSRITNFCFVHSHSRVESSIPWATFHRPHIVITLFMSSIVCLCFAEGCTKQHARCDVLVNKDYDTHLDTFPWRYWVPNQIDPTDTMPQFMISKLQYGAITIEVHYLQVHFLGEVHRHNIQRKGLVEMKFRLHDVVLRLLRSQSRKCTKLAARGMVYL